MSLTLDSLLEHALRNENLHRRYQALELSLIGAPDFAELHRLIEKLLAEA